MTLHLVASWVEKCEEGKKLQSSDKKLKFFDKQEIMSAQNFYFTFKCTQGANF